MLQIDWAEFKQFVDDHSLNIQYIEIHNSYLLKAYNGPFELDCQIPIVTPASLDQTDFETNYKPSSNGNLTQMDSDGALIQRTKTTKTGWHYEPRSLDFYTAKLNSLYNRKEDGNGVDDGTDYGDALVKYYNSAGTELVQGGSETDQDFQTRLTNNCTKTVLDWQSTYDFDIIGGSLQTHNEPTDRIYIWCTMAPDIPANMGGSVPYFAGGINLCFFKSGTIQRFDGRGIKSFAYDPVYNSNKIRFTVKHKQGEQIGLQIIIDQFRA
jgi:hypothetical protein